MSVQSHFVNPGDMSFHSSAEVRRVAAWLTAAFLGVMLVVNAILTNWWRPDAKVVADLSAMVGSVLLGAPVVWRALRDIWRGQQSMNELVALGIAACFVSGDYTTAGLVAFIMLFADLILTRTALGARESIEKLVRLAPTTARLIGENGQEQEVEAFNLKPGQMIRLRPGDNVPADGVIAKGETSLNEATVTGESAPADKGVGAAIFAGTVNLTGVVEVKVTRVGADTTLGKVRSLILDAEQTKIPLMRLIDRYIQWYTPVVVMLAAIIGFFTQDPNRAIAAIITMAPCAFILATPTAMVAALSCAARMGILIKNVRDLENASRLTAVVFDKTGTLTTGQLAVTRLAPAEGVDPAEMLRLAAAAERHSNHPVAQAVMRVAREARLSVPEAENIKETSGKGVAATVGGHAVLVGRPSWFEEKGIKTDALKVDLKQVESYSLLFVARDGQAIGWIGLEDKPRAEAKHAFSDLKGLGIRRLTMLTGDRWSVARKMAGELGCTEVEAECLPEQKLEIVKRMQEEGYTVAVVGDGVNDAPALAAGDIGIAMGAAGSDVAISSATIALMSDDLGRLPFLLRLSRRARQIVNQNLLFALVFIIMVLIGSAYGVVQVVMAAMLHIVATFVVIFNSARLVRFGEGYQGRSAQAR
ncbi:MAG TPA: cation-translocating P-type ATPase [Candidatus Brocadiia bacterium]|nr:cation-translocating P-type ATPase [Candidatus Brocadiia bacterium]